MLFELHDTVPYRILAVLAARNNILELGDVELLGICPEDLVPAFDTDDRDAVDLRVILESFECINDYRSLVNSDELLRDVLMHSVSGTAGDQ